MGFAGWITGFHCLNVFSFILAYHNFSGFAAQFSESLLVLFALPIYITLILAEIVFSYIHNNGYYSAGGTIQNIYLSSINFVLDIITRGFCLLVFTFVYRFHFIQIANPYLYFVSLFILQDFCFYVLHYVDHNCRLFWAIHVTHHNSEEFNLTVGFRSSVLQPLYRFVYFLPLILLGYKSQDVLLVYAVTQIYGILMHTRFSWNIGWLDRIFVTPSHHRVHHAYNIRYLDKNMRMVLIIWDRLFGTFQEEVEAPKYGLTSPLSFKGHPLKIIFHEWQNIFKDLRNDLPLNQKLNYIFGPPGWSHDQSRKTSKELQREMER